MECSKLSITRLHLPTGTVRNGSKLGSYLDLLTVVMLTLGPSLPGSSKCQLEFQSWMAAFSYKLPHSQKEDTPSPTPFNSSSRPCHKTPNLRSVSGGGLSSFTEIKTQSPIRNGNGIENRS